MRKSKINNYLGRNLSKEREPDKISKEKRSTVMSKIRSMGTKFELDFVNKLKKNTRKKFKTNVKELKGKPDIVFNRYKLCVFLDSDFWHGWQYPRWKHLMKNDFWRKKIEANRARDKKNTAWLRRGGWSVVRIWEHNIKNNIDKEINRILNKLNEKC
ncbi:MAG TPA: very short patch repair endonuclease [Smithella sp.]|nr:very short patch repair endonuclease [Smithella sp.]HNY49509.1 very short patch repair endonuclease [Smithella sp.]HOG89577.1 very short patch repair endonuclease [Smithella sp.]HQG65403.1 very short patch repair endonuclease [Smithella sp.]HQH17274.1 very short patch repair endonuclease [Smithella sp.]